MLLVSIKYFVRYTEYHQKLDKFLTSAELQNGDVIFRKGRSLASQAVVISDNFSDYSHVGIIRMIDNEPFVIHAVPGESDAETEFLKCEKVTSFLSVRKASRAAVFRCMTLTNATMNKIADNAYLYYKEKIVFDNHYDLTSDAELYCTELVWKIYKKSGIDLIQNQFDYINIPGKRGNIIYPGSFAKSSLLTKIYSY